MGPRRFVACTAVVSPLLVASCSSTDVVQKPSEPTVARYHVLFPSTAVAVTTDTVQVFVFDAEDGMNTGTDCLTLITKQGAGGELPGEPLRVSQSEPATPCDLLASANAIESGEPIAGKKGAVSVTYGLRSFLVVARRASKDYYIGCQARQISEANIAVEIPVSQANPTIPPPVTTCATLSDKCAGRCP
jgi:hypothetical protein